MSTLFHSCLFPCPHSHLFPISFSSQPSLFYPHHHPSSSHSCCMLGPCCLSTRLTFFEPTVSCCAALVKESKPRLEAAPDPSDKLYIIKPTYPRRVRAWAWKCPAVPNHPSRFPAPLPPIRPISRRRHHVDRSISRDTSPFSRRLHFLHELVITALFFALCCFVANSSPRHRSSNQAPRNLYSNR